MPDFHPTEKNLNLGKPIIKRFGIPTLQSLKPQYPGPLTLKLRIQVVNPRGINPRGIKTKGAGELGHEISSGWEKILEELRVKGSNFYQTFEYLRVKNPDCGIPDLPFNSKCGGLWNTWNL